LSKVTNNRTDESDKVDEAANIALFELLAFATYSELRSLLSKVTVVLPAKDVSEMIGVRMRKTQSIRRLNNERHPSQCIHVSLVDSAAIDEPVLYSAPAGRAIARMQMPLLRPRACCSN